MTNLYARKLEKIFNKIGQIASKGRDNRLEYSKYVDELIGKGDFVALQETLNIFYQMDTLNITDVNDLKSKTWNEICFQTKSTFLTRLSKLYKQKKYINNLIIFIPKTQKLQTYIYPIDFL